MKQGDNKTTESGFTLIELLVASSVFIITVAVAVGLFVSAMGAQRKVVAVQNVEDNARFILDLLTKDIRVSTITGGQDGQQRSGVTIRRSSGSLATYTFAGGDLVRTFEDDGEQKSLAVNGDDITVSGFFDVRGTEGNDNAQPVVTIVMEVRQDAARAEEGASLRLQSTIVQRQPQD